ncbi:hypothetical protein [Alishewanella tabrizica]|uniref:Uncharacterized protein n=1 Tax=Alishewanella tabrizica TaxID=671278 RepID=A0ABQ2WCZ9_9ALTE|nr:hypothetical protein [Alishewanella tabrizica]GGW50422.1 hypothetical protein GCM10008111_02910 [Alishewanella tabrizica]
MNSYEKAFLVSGRNTLIHKNKKLDLVIINDDDDPPLIVTRNGVKLFDEEVPGSRVEAKERYLELVDVSSVDVFGETKTLLFIQALNNKEYKVDYTKQGSDMFIRLHQDNYI